MVKRKTSNALLPPAAKSGSSKLTCCFCGQSEENELVFGKFYEHEGITTHYYCLLLSSNMEQKGEDHQGILGFLADDIHKEIKRGRRLRCSHCRKEGATLGCVNTKCKKIFHFPCGLKNNSLHQFYGSFASFCIKHRPRQKIDQKVLTEIGDKSTAECYICYESVSLTDTNDTIWAPCCKKNAFFHRQCVQQLAMSAGYFFKCPLCNNKKEFQKAMLEYGIYIPRQDASWELEPNAFQDLLYRHDQCDAKKCLCPKGRNYTSTGDPRWERVLCDDCGSQGTHLHCSSLRTAQDKWECSECSTILKKSDNAENNSLASNSNAPSSSQNRNGLASDANDLDPIEVAEKILALNTEGIPTSKGGVYKLKPGPRCFKLQQVEHLRRSELSDACNVSDDKLAPRSSSGELISIDSEDDDEVRCLDVGDPDLKVLCESLAKDRRKKRGKFSPQKSQNMLRRSNDSNTPSSSSSKLNLSASDESGLKSGGVNSITDLAHETEFSSEGNGLKRKAKDDNVICLYENENVNQAKRARLSNNANQSIDSIREILPPAVSLTLPSPSRQNLNFEPEVSIIHAGKTVNPTRGQPVIKSDSWLQKNQNIPVQHINGTHVKKAHRTPSKEDKWITHPRNSNFLDSASGSQKRVLPPTQEPDEDSAARTRVTPVDPRWLFRSPIKKSPTKKRPKIKATPSASSAAITNGGQMVISSASQPSQRPFASPIGRIIPPSFTSPLSKPVTQSLHVPPSKPISSSFGSSPGNTISKSFPLPNERAIRKTFPSPSRSTMQKSNTFPNGPSIRKTFPSPSGSAMRKSDSLTNGPTKRKSDSLPNNQPVRKNFASTRDLTTAPSKLVMTRIPFSTAITDLEAACDSQTPVVIDLT